MIYRPERGRMWDPSIFPYKGEYWMLAMHYDGPDAPPTGMWLARSADMVHWQGVGRVLEDSAIYNYGGEYDLKACLEDMATKLRADPSVFDREEDRLRFLRRYGVYATSICYEKE